MRLDGKREGFRQAMTWLHTWVGLLLGWLLFAIFLTGTLAFFKLELNHWSRPELRGLPQQPLALTAAQLAQVDAQMHQWAPQAQSWRLQLAEQRNPALGLGWREPPAQPGGRARFEQRQLDPRSLAPIAARETFGAGEFFYRFHFELRSAQQSQWIVAGRWLVGLATFAMLLALLTGIVAHRRFFKDFFTFRPRAKSAQRVWLDAHNVSGVLVLPFHLLITFSGLMIFHSLYMPAGIAAVYGLSGGTYFNELAGDPLPASRGLRPLAGQTQALPQLGSAQWQAMLDQAQRQWPGGRIASISLLREGGATLVEFARHDGDRLQYRSPRLLFDAQTGALKHLADTDQPAARSYGVLYGLHVARFADLPLRWLLFGLGLLGSAMVGSGLMLWAAKRQAERQRRGLREPDLGQRLVNTLNLGAIVGLPIAIAVFFHANRLLPLGLAERPDRELQCFFAAWGLSLLHAAWWPNRRGWTQQLALAALCFAALPLVNAANSGAHLGYSLAHGEWLLAAVDLGFVGAAMLLAALAWHSARGQPPRRVGAAPLTLGRA